MFHVDKVAYFTQKCGYHTQSSLLAVLCTFFAVTFQNNQSIHSKFGEPVCFYSRLHVMETSDHPIQHPTEYPTPLTPHLLVLYYHIYSNPTSLILLPNSTTPSHPTTLIPFKSTNITLPLPHRTQGGGHSHI